MVCGDTTEARQKFLIYEEETLTFIDLLETSPQALPLITRASASRC